MFKKIMIIWAILLAVGFVTVGFVSLMKGPSTSIANEPPTTTSIASPQVISRQLTDSELSRFGAAGTAVVLLYAEHCKNPSVSSKALYIAQRVQTQRPIEVATEMDKFRRPIDADNAWPLACVYWRSNVHGLNNAANRL